MDFTIVDPLQVHNKSQVSSDNMEYCYVSQFSVDLNQTGSTKISAFQVFKRKHMANKPYRKMGELESLPIIAQMWFNLSEKEKSDWQAMAWGASFLITAGVLGLTVVVRIVLGRRKTI